MGLSIEIRFQAGTKYVFSYRHNGFGAHPPTPLGRYQVPFSKNKVPRSRINGVMPPFHIIPRGVAFNKQQEQI